MHISNSLDLLFVWVFLFVCFLRQKSLYRTLAVLNYVDWHQTQESPMVLCLQSARIKSMNHHATASKVLMHRNPETSVNRYILSILNALKGRKEEDGMRPTKHWNSSYKSLATHYCGKHAILQYDHPYSRKDQHSVFLNSGHLSSDLWFITFFPTFTTQGFLLLRLQAQRKSLLKQHGESWSLWEPSRKQKENSLNKWSNSSIPSSLPNSPHCERRHSRHGAAKNHQGSHSHHIVPWTWLSCPP